MSLAGHYSFSMQRGADFSRIFRRKYKATGEPAPLPGYKVRAQFRTVEGAIGTSTSQTLLLELEDGSGIGFTNVDEAEVTLTLTAAQTQALAPGNTKTKVAYGIEFYDDSVTPERVEPFLQGRVTIVPETVR